MNQYMLRGFLPPPLHLRCGHTSAIDRPLGLALSYCSPIHIFTRSIKSSPTPSPLSSSPSPFINTIPSTSTQKRRCPSPHSSFSKRFVSYAHRKQPLSTQYTSSRTHLPNSKAITLLRPFSSSPTEPPRVNQLGIQYLSESLHKKVFPNHDPTAYANPKHPLLIDIAKDHLKHNQLLGKKTLITEPINIDNFPSIIGKSLDQHFYNIGKQSSVPYYEMAESFLSNTSELPPKPSKWKFKSGWTRYAPNEAPKSVEYPLEDELVFDVEVLYKRSKYPIMATCVSPEAWYGWVSPYLTEESDDWEHLIKLDVLKKPKLVVGYNVSFDRASVLDEYNIKQSKAFYLDAMALHVAVSGICSQQRPKWMKHKKNKQLLDDEDADVEPDSPADESAFAVFAQQEITRQIETELNEDPWLDKGSTNSLANVASFHCGLKMDKSDRDYFSGEDPQDIVNNFNSLMNYCSKDVEATFAVGKKLFPEFISKCPHPVSFSALRHLGTLILPTSRKWDKYIQAAEEIYQSNRSQVTKNLCDRANELVEYIKEKDETLKPDLIDPWLRQLDWSIKEPRLKKNGEPVANQAFLTGYPQWYRDLFKSIPGKKGEREMNLTVRTRITPLLLRLKWEGFTLLWTNSNGWCFKVPDNEALIEDMEKRNYVKANLTEDETISLLDELREETQNYVLFKVPHPDGASKRCTSILSKRYLQYFEKGVLTSEYNFAHEIIGLNTSASYWMGNRQRIMDQLVVYNDTTQKKTQFFDTKKESQANSEMGIILPRLCSMGTITRRATENTWLTASNAKNNRIGSELKSLVEAPPGYVFVGADVDSEELWIASLVGDSMFNIHGGTALGWMTLEGDKSEKTDLHSKTAEILGISRNDAKVFNYGRIYGAGVKFATRLLQQCNPNISQKDAEKTAAALYEKTKGSISASNVFPKPVYHGGSESIMFNALEAIAYQKQPRTPVLGSAITDALTAKNLNKNSYLTSRINWTIQSSGVDYLHLLIVSMEYLLELFQVQNARLAITVHDELRYMVRYEDRYKVALLLQISNLWTRAMFCEQLGIKEVPQSCAFFSEVDIDRYLRKDVNADCITPSNRIALPPGESLDIKQLLEKTENGKILPVKKKKINRLFKYNPRTPVISTLESETNINLKVAKLQAQNSTSKKDFRQNINLYIKLKEMGEGKKHSKKSEVKPVKSKESNTTNKTKPKDTTKSRTTARALPEVELGSDDCGQLEKEVEKFRPHNRHTRSVPSRPKAIKSRILRRLTGKSTMGQSKLKLNNRLRSNIFRRPDNINTVKLSA